MNAVSKSGVNMTVFHQWQQWESKVIATLIVNVEAGRRKIKMKKESGEQSTKIILRRQYSQTDADTTWLEEKDMARVCREFLPGWPTHVAARRPAVVVDLLETMESGMMKA